MWLGPKRPKVIQMVLLSKQEKYAKFIKWRR